MHYTVLLNLCHDLALVLEQFGMMCCYLKIGVVLILWIEM